jgi:hypothetical protein
VSRLSQKREKGLSHGHRSDVDDVSTNQSRVCDEVHVVVFLIQAAPLPEHLIGLDPQYYLEVILNGLNKTSGALTPEAVSEYVRCFCCTSTIHTTCEDLRAAADIDLEMDRLNAPGVHFVLGS